MASKLDNVLNFQAQALNLRAQRQQLLAANIANADTPNYKARDIDFGRALSQALAGRGQALAMATTSPDHLAAGSTISSPALMYRTQTQSNVDGNTVDMDVERAQFADNALHYEANVTFLSTQLRSMIDAMQPVK